MEHNYLFQPEGAGVCPRLQLGVRRTESESAIEAPLLVRARKEGCSPTKTCLQWAQLCLCELWEYTSTMGCPHSEARLKSVLIPRNCTTLEAGLKFEQCPGGF